MSIMQLTQTIHILPSARSIQSNGAVQPTLPGLEPEEETRPMVTSSLSKESALGSPPFSVIVSLIMRPRRDLEPSAPNRSYAG